MTEPKRRPRRGARAAKKAERAAPLAYDDRAVNPGMTGGNFSPLNDIDVAKVNDAVMDVLEKKASLPALTGGRHHSKLCTRLYPARTVS